jgi:glycosyltransferase involved in cell wall biosynthesis
METLRIAQVAPLFESVPPKLYGGTERVVSYLTEELVRLGHEITLFASGDSVTSAHLVSPSRFSLRLNQDLVDPLCYQTLLLEKVAAMANQFDLIHHHIDYIHFPISRRLKVPTLTTLHGRLDVPDLIPVYEEFSDMPVVSISKYQSRMLPYAGWFGNVYHGLPGALYQLQPKVGNYYAFLGRVSREKRLDRAIEIAIQTKTPLKIAAKVDTNDREYFEQKIAPLLNHPLIEFIGEIGEAEKGDFLGRARALLFPIDWPEPFGLVLIEAMACGVPVIAYRCGSVPEIVEEGVTGFVVDGMKGAIQACRNLHKLERARIRSRFESRFSATRMARDYVELYRQRIQTWKPSSLALGAPTHDRYHPAQR